MPMAAQHRLGPTGSRMLTAAIKAWIRVVPRGSGLSRRSENREALMMFDTSLSTHKSGS